MFVQTGRQESLYAEKGDNTGSQFCIAIIIGLAIYLHMLQCGSVFLVSAAFFGVLAAYLLAHYERKLRLRSVSWQAQALDRAIEVVNAANATIATILSSWVLATGDKEEVTNVRGRKPNSLAGWTVEIVCGYIVVELVLMLVARYRLPRESWEWIKELYKWMVGFHIVALAGLMSVLILDVGYPVAMWVVWSELTSVFLAAADFLEASGISQSTTKAHLYCVVKVSCAVLFVFQRVVVFLYLLWLCLVQFAWELTFVVQTIILSAGTVLNIVQAVGHIEEIRYHH